MHRDPSWQWIPPSRGGRRGLGRSQELIHPPAEPQSDLQATASEDPRPLGQQTEEELNSTNDCLSRSGSRFSHPNETSDETTAPLTSEHHAQIPVSTLPIINVCHSSLLTQGMLPGMFWNLHPWAHVQNQHSAGSALPLRASSSSPRATCLLFPRRGCLSLQANRRHHLCEEFPRSHPETGEGYFGDIPLPIIPTEEVGHTDQMSGGDRAQRPGGIQLVLAVLKGPSVELQTEAHQPHACIISLNLRMCAFLKGVQGLERASELRGVTVEVRLHPGLSSATLPDSGIETFASVDQASPRRDRGLHKHHLRGPTHRSWSKPATWLYQRRP